MLVATPSSERYRKREADRTKANGANNNNRKRSRSFLLSSSGPMTSACSLTSLEVESSTAAFPSPANVSRCRQSVPLAALASTFNASSLRVMVASSSGFSSARRLCHPGYLFNQGLSRFNHFNLEFRGLTVAQRIDVHLPMFFPIGGIRIVKKRPHRRQLGPRARQVKRIDILQTTQVVLRGSPRTFETVPSFSN